MNFWKFAEIARTVFFRHYRADGNPLFSATKVFGMDTRLRGYDIQGTTECEQSQKRKKP